MFKFAQTGIVTWPVKFPVDSDGNIVPTDVLVRFRVLTRAELREIENARVEGQRESLAETIASVMEPLKGRTDSERAAEQQARAETTLAALDEARKKGLEREDLRVARVLTRVVSIQPPGESEFLPVSQDDLEQQLSYELLLKAYEQGLLDASRGAVTKN